MDGRSWTEIFTNATSIAPNPDEDDPRPWLGDIPAGTARHVSPFLHEATHHWCFYSPVGSALLGLIGRAEVIATLLAMTRDEPEKIGQASHPLDVMGSLWRQIIGIRLDAGPGSVSDLLARYRSAEDRRHMGEPEKRLAKLAGRRKELIRAVAEDMVRVETAISLLRPLAEGLALFAQYDAVSRAACEAWSPFPEALAWYFYGPRELAALQLPYPHSAMVAAHRVLGQFRSSADALGGKADLLVSPLSAAAGGYLPGYLTVKSMWRHACARDGRLRGETDLFLMYLRCYVYDDWGLVEALLAPHDNPRRSVERIANHITRRLDDYERITNQDIAAFERQAVQDEPSPRPKHIRGVLIDPEVSSSGQASLEGLYEEIRDWEATPGGFGWGHGERMNRLTRRRPYVCVSSVPVLIDVDAAAGAAVTWREQRIFTPPSKDLLPGAESGRYDATLEILVALDHTFGRAAFLSHEYRDPARGGIGTPKTAVISCTAWGVPSQADALRAEMIEAYRDRDALIENSRTVKWLIDTTIEEEIERFEVDHVRRHLNDLADQTYRGTALWFARDTETIDACAEAMTTDGLAPILGNSRQLVRGLALLGLATMMNPERDAVAELFRRQSLDLDETLDQLRACWDRHGYPPRVRESGNELYCVI